MAKDGVETKLPSGVENYRKQGCTITYIAINREFAGYLALSDMANDETIE